MANITVSTRRGYLPRLLQCPVDFECNPATTANDQDGRQGAGRRLFRPHAELPGPASRRYYPSSTATRYRSAPRQAGKRKIAMASASCVPNAIGKVSRSFQLGQEIDDTGSRKFNEGVLELTLPKRAASPNKRLTVE